MFIKLHYLLYRKSQILFKQECNLLSLYHNVNKNYLMVMPDVNNLQFNPYDVEDGDSTLGYEYGVEIDFGRKETREDLEELVCIRILFTLSVSAIPQWSSVVDWKLRSLSQTEKEAYAQ